MAKVAFLGLGVMGFPMAGHLAAQGHEVTVWNRSSARARAWAAKFKGQVAATAKEAASAAEVLIIKQPAGVSLLVKQVATAVK